MGLVVFHPVGRVDHLIEHGGRLRRSAIASNTPIEDWVDLSTGIAPFHWPVPEIPASCWNHLPEEEDDLLQAASSYYGVSNLLAVDGSQCAIQSLPRLRRRSRVAVLSPTYAEHAHAWRHHRVDQINMETLNNNLNHFDVVVVVNPNNPTADYLSSEILLDWHENLSSRGGWLVVDEAFIDPDPDQSVIQETNRPGLIVLRSFGKFFGCPGARLGFISAHADILKEMQEIIGPWPVCGATRWIGQLALKDKPWQEKTKESLHQASAELATLLKKHGLKTTAGTALFQWVQTEKASQIYQHFLKKQILLRLFDRPKGLRFGLPDNQEAWQRLDDALSLL